MEAVDHGGRRLNGVAAGQNGGLLIEKPRELIEITTVTIDVSRHDGLTLDVSTRFQYLKLESLRTELRLDIGKMDLEDDG